MLLIHVGKCGGSNIVCKFKDIYNINIKSLHVNNKNLNQRKSIIYKSKNICLLLRDPITRYISIFYYWKNLYLKYLNNKNTSHIDKVLKYKKYFDYFKNANHLAEALSSNNIEKKSNRNIKYSSTF